MPVKVEVKLDVDSMADFMVYNIYTSGPGMVALILGVLNMGLAVSFIMKGDFFAGAYVPCICIPDTGHLPVFYQKKSGKADAEFQEAGCACDL